MKAFTAASAAILGMVGLASAHMEMKDPAPFRSKFNPHTTDIDYSMTNPLNRDGSDFPCKGYHNLVGTPQGASVANWTPGQSLTMTVTGGTPHNGGSCQASLSYDGGSTWTALHSYYGNCPVMGDSSYAFTLPNDTPSGQALFAWSWFNQIGNREMYMNCAVVTIGSAKRDLMVRGPQDPFGSRPAMFVANVGNGCSTTEGTDVQFPNPGPDVTNVSSKLGPPVGSCGARKAPVSGAGSKRSTLVLPSSTVPFQAPFRPIAETSSVPEASASSSVSSETTTPAPVSSEASTSVVAVSSETDTTPSSLPSETDCPVISPPNSTLPIPKHNVTLPIWSPNPWRSNSPTFTTIVDDSVCICSPFSRPEAPSTLLTATRPAPTATNEDESVGPFAEGESCDQEGAWNCVDGATFQRCASGSWTEVEEVYPGTACKVGVSTQLSVAREKSPPVNYDRVLRQTREAELKAKNN